MAAIQNTKYNKGALRSIVAIALAIMFAYGVHWWLVPASQPWRMFFRQSAYAGNAQKLLPAHVSNAAEASQSPRQNPSHQDTQAPAVSAAWQTDCTIRKCIALTFDDGPNSVTPRLLDILKTNNTRASFFVIGRQIAGHETIIKRMQSEGHDIGNHTWDHLDFKKIPLEVMEDQVARTDQAIEAVTGKKPMFVRPPFGSFSPEHLATANRPFVLWNIDPDDWTAKDSNAIHDRVMAVARPGAIIVSHDIYDATADAYARVIPELQQQDYSLVTVSDLLDLGPGNLPAQPFYYQ
ncbi:MAG: polysaccharide deacetylase family protein [Candidatus Saccharimonadales bacterium]